MPSTKDSSNQLSTSEDSIVKSDSSSWRKRFEFLVMPLEMNAGEVWKDYIYRHHKKIEAFISSVEQAARESEREKITEAIKDMPQKYSAIDGKDVVRREDILEIINPSEWPL